MNTYRNFLGKYVGRYFFLTIVLQISLHINPISSVKLLPKCQQPAEKTSNQGKNLVPCQGERIGQCGLGSSAATSCSKHTYNRRHNNNYQVLLRFSLLAKSNVKKVSQLTTSQRHAQSIVDFGIETP
jgi:hypothetical protein